MQSGLYFCIVWPRRKTVVEARVFALAAGGGGILGGRQCLRAVLSRLTIILPIMEIFQNF